FHAQPPNLRSVPLMEMDFAVSCPLVRHSRLRFGSCTSARVFAPRFLQTPPRGDALAVRYPSPPSGWEKDFHPQAVEHARHPPKRASRIHLDALPIPDARTIPYFLKTVWFDGVPGEVGNHGDSEELIRMASQ